MMRVDEHVRITLTGRSDAGSDDRRDLGGDPACWAHLFDDTDEPTHGEAAAAAAVEVTESEAADDRTEGGDRCAPS